MLFCQLIALWRMTSTQSIIIYVTHWMNFVSKILNIKHCFKIGICSFIILYIGVTSLPLFSIKFTILRIDINQILSMTVFLSGICYQSIKRFVQEWIVEFILIYSRIFWPFKMINCYIRFCMISKVSDLRLSVIKCNIRKK